MAISLPERTTTAVGSLTPREIVAELDKYVIGQAKAKRAVAIALRNRLRRQRLSADIADEVTPKNIRIRKRMLLEHERKRASRVEEALLA